MWFNDQAEPQRASEPEKQEKCNPAVGSSVLLGVNPFGECLKLIDEWRENEIKQQIINHRKNQASTSL